MTAAADAWFAEHATLEAITAHLNEARTVLAAADRRVIWLADLHATRAAQIAAGEWPTTNLEETR